ncbi:SDH family Clp fold serine proteinase [Acidovorax delafieldii]|uniref:SDH family Clp fold serine proteinase n=1 Tax=Acidovorax delafieldii TaxID=47920 RepID=UPI003ED0D0D0
MRDTQTSSDEAVAKVDGETALAVTVAEEPVPATARKFSKTPAFQAMHALRYRRQELISEIEKVTGNKLICYLGGHSGQINRDDAVFFGDLLHNIPANHPVDLLLQTPGGDIDAAEKLFKMIRNRVRSAQLRVIVPDYAKSAGTLIALGADVVMMSDSSELGPIDPQVTLEDSSGNQMATPIHSYLEAFREHSEALRRKPDDPVALQMLKKIDPIKFKHFEMVMRRARTIAEELLQQGMLRSRPTASGPSYTKIANDLLDPALWPSHGQMICAEDAIEIGLTIDRRDPDDEEWQMFWQLYCYQRMELPNASTKLFESYYACLHCDSAT